MIINVGNLEIHHDVYLDAGPEDRDMAIRMQNLHGGKAIEIIKQAQEEDIDPEVLSIRLERQGYEALFFDENGRTMRAETATAVLVRLPTSRIPLYRLTPKA